MALAAASCDARVLRVASASESMALRTERAASLSKKPEALEATSAATCAAPLSALSAVIS
jgi:hypothetical protein